MKLINLEASHVKIAAEIDCKCFCEDIFSAKMIKNLLVSPNIFGFLAIEDDEPVGYAMFAYIAGEGEILTIAVLKKHRGKNIAKELLKKGFKQLIEENVKNVFLEVRESNITAQKLYNSFGSKKVGVRPKYYTGPVKPEDALVFKIDITATTP